MMNAGMFHPDHSPVGLQIIDGTVRNPINTDDGQGNFFLKPNGVFALGEQGAVVQAQMTLMFRSRGRLLPNRDRCYCRVGSIIRN